MTERDPQQPPAGTPPAPPAGAGPSAAPTVVWTPLGQDAAQEVIPPPATRVEPPPRGSTLRWGIALLVTVLVVAGAFAAVVLLAGQSAPSKLVGYVPADSVVYGELRLDLPGDQRQKLGQFLSKFPGFDDQATLDTKLDEVLDRFVRTVSSDGQDYTTKIKPWFGGEVAFSLGQLPDRSQPEDVRGVLIVSVTDPVKARAWFDELSSGMPKTTESYNGTELVLGGAGKTKSAFGIVGAAMLLGDEASVKQAIDTRGAGAFASNTGYRTATAAFDGDSLGSAFVDLRRYLDWAVKPAKTDGTDLGFTFDEAYFKKVPEWVAFRLQARGDGIAMEAVTPRVETKVPQENRASRVAPHLPPSTIAVVEGHEIGATVLEALDLYRQNPGTAEAFKQVDQAASMLGGFDSILGWIQDGTVVLTRNGTAIDGGLVFTSRDRAAGERLLTTLRGFVVLAGGQSGITVKDVPHGDATISIVDFGDLRDLATMANIPNMPFSGRFTLAYTSTADVIVFGPGDGFVKAVLDTRPGASLADDARYKSLLDRVGAKNLGSTYVDLAAVRELLEQLGAQSPQAMAAYTTNIKPYLLPFDAFIEANFVDGEHSRLTGIVVVK